MSAATEWTDDVWFEDQDNRTVRPNDGYWAMQHGQATGQLIGGNLCTFNLLQGTEYMPSLRGTETGDSKTDRHGTIVAIEDDDESSAATFDRDLTSLIQQPDFDGVQGLLIGRFQASVGMTRDLLGQILSSKPQLVGLPILANVDFGHTCPLLTLPIGGQVSIRAGDNSWLEYL